MTVNLRKNGTFRSVLFQGQEYTVKDWNKRLEDKGKSGPWDSDPNKDEVKGKKPPTRN